MNNITHKISTQRTATAMAKVICNNATFLAVENNKLPKGMPFDICKAAGLLAAKQTPYLIPHCHPVLIDGLSLEFHLSNSPEGSPHFSEGENGVWIKGFAKYVGRTGIEMEVLTAVSVAALTLYDLLKPLGSKDLVIDQIRLLEKTGGRSQQKQAPQELREAVLLNLSTRPIDKVTPLLTEFLEQNGVKVIYSGLVSDINHLTNEINHWSELQVPLIFTLGKTSAHYNLKNTMQPLLDSTLDGIIHAMYHHGYQRSPESVDSTLLAGFVRNSLLLTLPGSQGGAKECLEAVLPMLFQPLAKKRKK